MEHIYLITYLMDGIHEHRRISANDANAAKRKFKNEMGSRYEIVEVTRLI